MSHQLWSCHAAIDSDGCTASGPSASTGIDGPQTNNLAGRSGAVYVFTRSGAARNQQAYVKASNTGTSDGFGAALALSADGSTMVVGATPEAGNVTGVNGFEGDNSAPLAGAVYVFSRSGATWSQAAYVKPDAVGPNHVFGSAAALSADGATLAVGAREQGGGSGAVVVFGRTADTWSQRAYLKAGNPRPNYQFGLSVAVSGDGNTLAVGSNRESSNATGINGNQADTSLNSSGAAFIY